LAASDIFLRVVSENTMPRRPAEIASQWARLSFLPVLVFAIRILVASE